MKKWMVIFAAVSALSVTPAFAQRGLPGQWAVEVAGGPADGILLRGRYADKRLWCSLSFLRWNGNRTRWTFGTNAMWRDYAYNGAAGRELVPVVYYTATASYDVPVWIDGGHNVVLSAGIGALAGYERVNGGRPVLADGATLLSRSGFIYGPTVNITLEVYVCDRAALLIRAATRCTVGSSTGRFRTLLGAGFLITLN